MSDPSQPRSKPKPNEPALAAFVEGFTPSGRMVVRIRDRRIKDPECQVGPVVFYAVLNLDRRDFVARKKRKDLPPSYVFDEAAKASGVA